MKKTQRKKFPSFRGDRDMAMLKHLKINYDTSETWLQSIKTVATKGKGGRRVTKRKLIEALMRVARKLDGTTVIHQCIGRRSDKVIRSITIPTEIAAVQVIETFVTYHESDNVDMCFTKISSQIINVSGLNEVKLFVQLCNTVMSMVQSRTSRDVVITKLGAGEEE